jgi:hypothetical protein
MRTINEQFWELLVKHLIQKFREATPGEKLKKNVILGENRRHFCDLIIVNNNLYISYLQ